MKWLFFVVFIVLMLFGSAWTYDGIAYTKNIGEIWFTIGIGISCLIGALTRINFTRSRSRKTSGGWNDPF